MSRYLNLLDATREVVNREVREPDALQDLLFNCLDTILILEGPPEDPIDGVSTGFHEGFIFKGHQRPHPVAYGYTWLTGPWRCLLLDVPSIAMSRPIPFEQKEKPNQAPDPESGEEKEGSKKAKFWMPIDWASMRFQGTVKAACEGFGIADPMSAGAVHAVFHNTRAFIAWRHREQSERYATNVRGDVDNYLKNTLDALQGARILVNDRGVFRATGSKEEPPSWTRSIPPDLESRLQKAALHLRDDQNLAPAEVRTRLHLTHKQTREIFPEYLHGRQKVSEGARKRGAPTAVARGVERVLAGEADLELVAASEGISPVTLKARLRRSSVQGRPRATKAAMDEAVGLVLQGAHPKEAATASGVTLLGLKARLNRDGIPIPKKRTQGKVHKARKARLKAPKKPKGRRKKAVGKS